MKRYVPFLQRLHIVCVNQVAIILLGVARVVELVDTLS